MDWLSTYTPYLNVCEKAMVDDDEYENFRNRNDVINVLEVAHDVLGMVYLHELLRRVDWNLLKELNWKRMLENDNIGSPKKWSFEEQLKPALNLESYYMAPTTIRYICTGIDILKRHRGETLNIVEIGSGYGGQCKILFDLAPNFNVTIKSYKLIDLNNAAKLSQKFLSDLNVPQTTISYVCYEDLSSTPNASEAFDLCISNYSLAEVPRDVQDFYMDSIVKNSKGVYCVWNSVNIHPYFQNNERFDIEMEIPRTGPNNKVITSK